MRLFAFLFAVVLLAPVVPVSHAEEAPPVGPTVPSPVDQPPPTRYTVFAHSYPGWFYTKAAACEAVGEGHASHVVGEVRVKGTRDEYTITSVVATVIPDNGTYNEHCQIKEWGVRTDNGEPQGGQTLSFDIGEQEDCACTQVRDPATDQCVDSERSQNWQFTGTELRYYETSEHCYLKTAVRQCVADPLFNDDLSCADGEKSEKAILYQGTGPDPLTVALHYSQRHLEDGRPDTRGIWNVTNTARMVDQKDVSAVKVLQPNGNSIPFGYWRNEQLNAVSVLPDSARPGMGHMAFDGGSQWQHTYRDTVYTFNGGLLTSKTTAQGFTTTYGYDDAQRLITTTNHFGQQVRYHYNGNAVSTIDTPDGKQFQLAYNGRGLLSQITYPDDSTKTYHYENGDYPGLLTGVSDGLGNRYLSVAYDDQGRAIEGTRGDGFNRVNFSHYPDNTVVTEWVSDTQYRTSVVELQSIYGQQRVIRQETIDCSDCAAVTTTRAFNSRGQLVEQVDATGIKTTYQWDNLRELKTRIVVGADTGQAQTTVIEWDNRFRLPTRITTDTLETVIAYNDHALQSEVVLTDRASGAVRRTTYTYNDQRLLAQIDGPRTDVDDITRFTYNSAGFLMAVTNALGHTTTLGDLTADGRPRTLTDANGLITRIRYDALNRIVGLEQPGRNTTYQYNAAGLLTRVQSPDGQVLDYTYDSGHRLISLRNGQGESIHYTRDGAGHVTETRITDPQDRLQFAQQAIYNGLGQLRSQLGNHGQQTVTEFDDRGNPVNTTDGEGYRTRHVLDALNRLHRVIDPLQGETALTWHNNGQLATVTDAIERTTAYRYNGFGEIIELDSPDTGITTYRHDSAGNRVSRTDARGVRVDYHYDALNRLIRIDYPNDADVTFEYDQGNAAKGRLTGMHDAHSQQTITYTVFGELATLTTRMDGQDYIQRYEYHDNGQLARYTTAGGQTLTYTYDDQGRVSSVHLNDAPLATAVDYLPFGPQRAMTLGNGIAVHRDFDTDYRLTGASDGVTQDSQYQYSLRNNVITILDSINGRDDQFAYDALARLDSILTPTGTAAHVYNAIGDKAEEQDVLAPVALCRGVVTRRAWWDFAGHTDDLGDNGNHGTLHGTASLGSDPNYDYLTLTGNGGLSIDNDPSIQVDAYTVSAWIKTTNAGSGHRGIVVKHGAYGVYLWNNRLTVYDWSRYHNHVTGATLNDNQWHHIMITKSAGMNGTLIVYADGEEVYRSQAGISTQGRNLVFGAGVPDFSIQQFHGQLARVEIFDGPLTPQEVLDFDPDAEPAACATRTAFTSTWQLAGETTASLPPTFKETNAYLVDTDNDLSFVRFSQASGHNGSGIIFPMSNALSLDSYTLSAWIRTDDAGSGHRGIIVQGSRMGLFLYDNRLATYDWYYGRTHVAGPELNDGEWHHLAITKEPGNDGHLILYLDGEALYSTPYSPQISNYNVVIGSGYRDASQQNFGGDIAHVGISAGVMTPAQIASAAQAIPGFGSQHGVPVDRIITMPSPETDAHGNVLALHGHRFDYNDAGRLSQSTSASGLVTTYAYNAREQRVSKRNANGHTGYVYDTAGQLVAEVDSDTGAVGVEYFYLNNQRLASIKNGQLYYVHHNHLGAPIALTDTTGNLAWAATYDAFGSITVNLDNVGGFSPRLPGQYEDAETGLYYNWHRYYDPRGGRYITSDPLGLAAGVNTYSYVSNNPVNFIDPEGLTEEGANTGFAIGCGIGGFFGSAGGVTFGGASGLLCGPGAVACSPAAGAAMAASGGALGCGAIGAIGSFVGDIVSDIVEDFNCDDDCPQLEAEIKSLATELRGRFLAALKDKHDLFNRAHIARNLGKRKGTWIGHQKQFQEKQKRLKSKIVEADSKGCKVSAEDRKISNTSFPVIPAAR